MTSAPAPRAKKSFGQNFLHDPRILGRIADLCAGDGEHPIIELGAGSGNLTLELARRCRQRIIAVERDRDLIPDLRARLEDSPWVEVLETNAKTLDIEQQVGAQPFVLCGNIPYNLSSPLLGLALNQAGQVTRVIYLLQLELARRLAAPAGTRDCGALSVLLQQRFEVSLAFKVGRGAFVPAPRVDSAVLHMQAIPGSGLPQDVTRSLDQIVHAAFAGRRKMLRGALSSVLTDAEDLLRAAQIDPRRRAENLGVTDFVNLARLWTQKKEADAQADRSISLSIESKNKM